MNSYVIFLKDTFFHHKIVLLQVLPFPLQVSQLTFTHKATQNRKAGGEEGQKIQSVSRVPKHD